MQQLVQLLLYLCIHQTVCHRYKSSFSAYCQECHAFCFVNALACLACLCFCTNMVLSVNSVAHKCCWLCWTCMHKPPCPYTFVWYLPKPDKGIGLLCLDFVWLQKSKALLDISQALSTISIELEYGLSLALYALQGVCWH